MTLYNFHFDCGRQGTLNGMFAVDARGEAALDALIASRREVYFGEVLGKHSEVSGPIDPGDVSMVDATPEEVATVCRILCGGGDAIAPDGFPWCDIHGFNPLSYLAQSCEVYTWDSEGEAKFLAACRNEASK